MSLTNLFKKEPVAIFVINLAALAIGGGATMYVCVRILNVQFYLSILLAAIVGVTFKFCVVKMFRRHGGGRPTTDQK
jgi:hypothetical protein